MTVACGHIERHLIVARLGVGVSDVLSRSSLSVTKSPLVALNLLAAGVGGGGAGELRRRPFTNRGVVEVGRGLWIDDHFSGGAVRCGANSDSASVCAGMGHRAVVDGWVLLV